ncbi:MAG: hypothetical protein M1343_13105 [Chloroflexi bacterium]|nr:hypothetical protein [Chloroflexota bacterium]MDA8188061.1 hypothetical protein [Dehalococcoidales bacterium]
MITTALTPATSNLPTVYKPIEDVEGLEGFDRSDVTIPRRSIIQPTSDKNRGELGSFFDNLTGEAIPEMEVIILRISKSRALWTPGENRSKNPECRSNDSIHGCTVGENPVERLCTQCEYNPDVNQSLWDKATFNPRVHRRCPEQRDFLCIDYADGSMFQLTAKGMSVKSIKPIISLFANTRKPVYSAIIKLWAQLDPDGTYCMLKGQKVRWLEGEELGGAKEMFDMMRGVEIKDIDADDTGNVDTHADNAPF